MGKKKGLSRQFTREIRLEEELTPSKYDIVPQKIPRIDLDDPTEEIKRHKEFLNTREEKVVKFPKPSQPVKLVEHVKLETPNKDKIKLIADKLNFLKKNKEEREEKEKTNLIEKKEPSVKKEADEGNFSSKFKPVSLAPPKKPAEKKIKKTDNVPEKEDKEANKRGFLKKIFSKTKEQETKNVSEEKPETKKQEIQSKLEGEGSEEKDSEEFEQS